MSIVRLNLNAKTVERRFYTVPGKIITGKICFGVVYLVGLWGFDARDIVEKALQAYIE